MYEDYMAIFSIVVEALRVISVVMTIKFVL